MYFAENVPESRNCHIFPAFEMLVLGRATGLFQKSESYSDFKNEVRRAHLNTNKRTL